jgi:hypothetical protein
MRSASSTQRARLARWLSACGMTHGAATRRCLAAHDFTVGDVLLLLLLQGVVRTGLGRALAPGSTCGPLVTRGQPERTLEDTCAHNPSVITNTQSRTTKKWPGRRPGARDFVLGWTACHVPPEGGNGGGMPRGAARPQRPGEGIATGWSGHWPISLGALARRAPPPCCFAGEPWDAEAVQRKAFADRTPDPPKGEGPGGALASTWRSGAMWSPPTCCFAGEPLDAEAVPSVSGCHFRNHHCVALNLLAGSGDDGHLHGRSLPWKCHLPCWWTEGHRDAGGDWAWAAWLP